MSSNKGKDGEMRITRLLCDISETTDGCDFSRPTITNDSDGGADLILKHPKGFLDNLVLIGEGGSGGALPTLPTLPEQQTETSRIDVKNTENKITKHVAEKFIGQIKLNPECDGHVLMGGSGCTKGAQKALDEAADVLDGTGKRLIHISNESAERITKHYRAKLQEGNNNSEEKNT